MWPIRRFMCPKPRRGLSPVTRPASLVRCSTSWVQPSANSRVRSPAFEGDLTDRSLTNSSDADRCVEEGSETILLVRFRTVRRWKTLRRVPLAVGREPPAAALGVLVQRFTPHPSQESRMSVASKIYGASGLVGRHDDLDVRPVPLRI